VFGSAMGGAVGGALAGPVGLIVGGALGAAIGIGPERERRVRGKGETAPVTLRLRTVQHTIDRLKRAAARDGSDVNAVVHEAIHKHLHESEKLAKEPSR